MSRNKSFLLHGLNFLVLDVDGVLTDGKLLFTSSGESAKVFNVKDGAGIKYWHRLGYRSAIITGRESPIISIRAAELGISRVFLGAKDKLLAFNQLISEENLNPEHILAIGDDLPDLPILKRVGFSVAVSDAVSDVRRLSDYTTTLSGGNGAVREIIELVLQYQNKWDLILSRY